MCASIVYEDYNIWARRTVGRNEKLARLRQRLEARTTAVHKTEWITPAQLPGRAGESLTHLSTLGSSAQTCPRTR